MEIAIRIGAHRLPATGSPNSNSRRESGTLNPSGDRSSAQRPCVLARFGCRGASAFSIPLVPILVGHPGDPLLRPRRQQQAEVVPVVQRLQVVTQLPQVP